MKKRFLFISCEEAKHICDKTQYDEASLWERIKLNIRLSWCRITRAYTKRNRKLTKLMKTEGIQVMSSSDKNSLQQAFSKELANHK
jgi:hypothetical protein